MASAPQGFRLLTDDVWPRLTKLAREGGAALVAVPYFGTGGAKQLPLAEGSRLVVNCSQAAVKSGQVNPTELLTLLRRGVEIHSSPDLHAKVFVFRSRAIVGSANVSERSRDLLHEAAIETSNRDVVRSCREFVRSLLGDELGEESLKKLARAYRPPRTGAGKGKRPGPLKRKQAPAWIVGLGYGDWDETTKKLAPAERETASKRIRDEAAYRVDQFRSGGRMKTEWKRGERVIQVTKEARGTEKVWPPARILSIRKYATSRGVAFLVSVEMPKRKKAKPLSLVRKLTGYPTQLKGNIDLRQLRQESVLAAIAAIWNPK